MAELAKMITTHIFLGPFELEKKLFTQELDEN